MNEKEDAYYGAAEAWFKKINNMKFRKKVDMRYFIEHPPFITESELTESMLQSKQIGYIPEFDSPKDININEENE